MNLKPAFTLIELLVVFAILGILTVLGVGNFQTARLKARDVTRKSDLVTISKSLEAYANDYRSYPTDQNGLIICQPPNTTCDWGDPFVDSKDTIYAAKLPTDPTSDTAYYYDSNGTTYTIYAHLENELDGSIVTGLTQSCGDKTCNYQLKSSNQL